MHSQITNLRLPTAAELPDSDETPVDNELQNDTPNLLLEILRWIWRDRSDWFWGVDMALYYEPDLQHPENSKFIVPDGFLALQVEKRRPDQGGRFDAEYAATAGLGLTEIDKQTLWSVF